MILPEESTNMPSPIPPHITPSPMSNEPATSSPMDHNETSAFSFDVSLTKFVISSSKIIYLNCYL